MYLNFARVFVVSFSVAPVIASFLSAANFGNIIATEATIGIEGKTSSEEINIASDAFRSKVILQLKKNRISPRYQYHPFVICDHTRSKNGEVRTRNIISSINSKLEFSDLELLKNSGDMTCYRMHVSYPQYSRFLLREYSRQMTITPMFPAMKIIRGAFPKRGTFPRYEDGSLRYKIRFCQHPSPKNQIIEWIRVTTVVVVKTATTGEACFVNRKRNEIMQNSIIVKEVESTESLDMVITFTRPHLFSDSCIRSIIETVAAYENVCLVMILPPVSVLNSNVQWIVQGGTETGRETHFYDLGLAGLGQIAALSDTGVAVNSCYFFDQNGEVVRDKSGVSQEKN
mmetsp:Transcript_36605/g.85566  ORF Transcript_36605/g.85566 Transcript_36605/m.85566 type:complete len:342 (-) Transcript_36605:436-1461(-)